MGSSKKHKEKDRERDHKKKRKHRSRSRSRSRERSERKKHKKSKSSHKERSASEEGEIAVYDYGHGQSAPDQGEVGSTPPKSSGGAGGDISLSMDETNKLRAKLGLPPLKMDGDNSQTDDSKPKIKEDVHVPAVNQAEKRRQAEIQEKLAAIRSKRLINKKLGKVKTLGESDSDEEEGALAWIKKSRKQQKEKALAEKRAKLLEEMDNEFGIGNIVDEEFGTTKKKEYTSRDLRGIKVQHDQEEFSEGKTVILTLEDKRILDDDGDVLMNVNIKDVEAAKKNIENKKKKPDYQPWDNEEEDEYGMVKVKEVLSKYDEEIAGERKKSFALGMEGSYNADSERQMAMIRNQLKNQAQSLQLSAPNIASEYYTEQEMKGFKKVKKKVRKIRKKTAVKADDLIPLESESRNHGSRSGVKQEVDADGEMLWPHEMAASGRAIEEGQIKEEQDMMEVDKPDPMDDSEIQGPDEDLTGVTVDEDDGALELELALRKARKLKHKKEQTSVPTMVAENVVQTIKEEPSDSEPDPDDMELDTRQKNIMLNSVAEFCRTLGDIPTYGQSGNRTEDQQELLDFERELQEERRRKEEEEANPTGWARVEIDEQPVDLDNDKDEAVIIEEPSAAEGMGAALALAMSKGYLEKEVVKKVGATKAKGVIEEDSNWCIEDKRHDDIDEKYKNKTRDRFSGITMDFKEKAGYKPIVQLEYVDDNGRFMNQKEAFRVLSHRFHGKGSGKKKTEKREKKIEEEELMKQMSSTDTPLNTVARLKEKLNSEKTPFLVLSGGSKTLTSASTSLVKR
ncbi:unnamed protein product [Owenia fusiformis]|uniref:SART-1 n=1 Tax=Owenia fusiformis TaxID=6347 RepID=A0A8S4PE69_OWEFU|nr:unnamed protein product [Owenia fusiformis]